jgi:hypothetical protein
MPRTRAENNVNGRAAQQMVDELDRLADRGWRIEDRLGNDANNPPAAATGNPHGTASSASSASRVRATICSESSARWRRSRRSHRLRSRRRSPLFHAVEILLNSGVAVDVNGRHPPPLRDREVNRNRACDSDVGGFSATRIWGTWSSDRRQRNGRYCCRQRNL